MKTHTLLARLAVMALLGSMLQPVSLGAPDEDAARKAAGTPLGTPFWATRVMEHEPILFIQEEGKAVASGKLLFIPSAKPTITHPDLVMTYEEGKDYTWNPGEATIALTPNTRIPFKTASQMKPATGGLGGRLWSEGHFFHDLQVQASYEHTGSWTWQPVPATQVLTRSQTRLQEKKAFRIVALGDSITEGYNASGLKKVWVPPYQPPYPQLVATTLQERYKAPVTLINLGVAGTVAGNGMQQLAMVKAEKPDLVLIAYGMNHGDTGPGFETIMRTLVAGVQEAAPEADIVLVAPMTQAPQQGKVAEKFPAYRDALSRIVTKHVALADVTTPFMELLKRKEFSDLSGNNVNHPNDFTHRLYAHVICQLL